VGVAERSDSSPWWFDLASNAINWVAFLAALVVVSIFADSIAHVLAGKNTHVTVSLTVTVAITLVGVAASLVAWARVRVLTKRVRRQNTRIRSLETDNRNLRDDTPPPLFRDPGPTIP